MPDNCPKCGLPIELCACEIIEKEETTNIVVYTTKKKFKKLVTIIEGIEKEMLNETTKKLKQKLACGGTQKDGLVVLQGDHLKKIKKALVSVGYLDSNIKISSRK